MNFIKLKIVGRYLSLKKQLASYFIACNPFVLNEVNSTNILFKTQFKTACDLSQKQQLSAPY